MITITRAQARQFRTVLRKSAPIGESRSYRPALSFEAGAEGLRIRSHHADVAVEWTLPGPRPPETLVLPYKALDDFEGVKNTEVALSLDGKDMVQARWDDGGVPQGREYATVSLDKLPPFPREPALFGAQDAGFLKSLDDATQTTARNNVRFAVSRVQLRGLSGEIVSTDGHQLLLQRGFKFPWKEDALIPSSGAFGCRELQESGPAVIGWTESHVCVGAGAWKLFLTNDKDSHYPRAERGIPSPFTRGSSFQVAPEDAAFLLHALPRLPSCEEEHDPITVDLNGQVMIRAREQPESRVTELLLTRSAAKGPAVRWICNRKYLAHALKLGFTEFFVQKVDVPIVARDQQRLYVWMPLNKDEAIAPTKDAIRIESTNASETIPPTSAPERRSKPMPVPPTNGHVPNGSPEPNNSDRNPGIAELLSEAEDLRTVLHDASARLHRLINGLKHHRRQGRAMQAAMQSLRQLKLDA